MDILKRSAGCLCVLVLFVDKNHGAVGKFPRFFSPGEVQCAGVAEAISLVYWMESADSVDEN